MMYDNLIISLFNQGLSVDYITNYILKRKRPKRIFTSYSGVVYEGDRLSKKEVRGIVQQTILKFIKGDIFVV